MSALTWVVAWVPLSIALTSIAALAGGAVPPRELWGVLLYREAAVGAINGAVFGATLA